jgi:Mg-chelatase subunit ChlD
MTADESTGHRRKRWRLVLGEPAAEPLDTELTPTETEMDEALSALYDEDADSRPNPLRLPRRSGLGSSAPRVARWLGDIRRYFPTSVVQVMQHDAVERLQLTSMLLEPELLSAIQPDVHLVATLVGLNKVMPETTRNTARTVVRTVVAEIERRIAQRTRSAVGGAIDRSTRTRRPRPGDIDWLATIGRNLDHYQPEYGTVIPERLVGRARSRRSFTADVIVAVDQSGSMAESLVYAAVFAAVLATLNPVHTSLVVFDTAVADLSELLADPVDVLFGCQLGGGTDINAAIAYCSELVRRPQDTLLVLISDLYEGGDAAALLQRVGDLVRRGVRIIVLLALADSGAPAYDRELAAALAGFGIPAFACTPDAFPELLAVALGGGDVAAWVAARTDAPAPGGAADGVGRTVGGSPA